MRHDEVGEQLLRLDRLPVREPAGVDRDRHLGQPLADVADRLDPLDHVVRGADPDDVAVDHVVVGRRGELLHDPGDVEAVAGGVHVVVRRQVVVARERRGVALEELPHPALGLAPGRVAVLVDVAGVDPDDVRLGAVLGALGAVEVELVLERGVGKERRHDDGPAVLGGELVRPVARAAEEDAELALGPRPDVGVVDRVVRAVVGEALVVRAP